MSQYVVQEHDTLDFLSVFGEASDTDLLEELRCILGKTDVLDLFLLAYAWFHSSSETCYAEEHFRVFTDNGQVPYYIKFLLFKFRTEEGFHI